MGQGNGIADLGWTRGSGQDARVREQAKDPPDVSWRSGRVQAVSAHRGHRMGLLAQRRAVCGSRPACPGSASGLPGVRPANGPWSGYQRWVRSGGEVWRIWVCRAKCRPCGVTHALLPSFALLRRLDAVEVVGAALERAAGGAGLRVVAAGLGVPHTTVRDWWRRFRVRAPVLVAGLCALVVELGGLVAAVDAVGEHACLGALGALAVGVRRGVAERHHEPALGRAGRAGLDAARAPTPALKEVAVPTIHPSGSDDPAEQVALFRYRVIAEPANPRLSAAERGRLVRVLAAQTHAHPDGTMRAYSRGTLDRWIAAYQTHGLAGLRPVRRADAGAVRRHPQLLAEAAALRSEQPARSAAHIADILRARYGIVVSERTVRAHLRRKGLDRASLGTQPALVFGRYEAERPNQRWIGDVLSGPFVPCPRVAGSKRAKLFMLVDDHYP